MSIEAMKQALEVMETVARPKPLDCSIHAAISDLRAAITEAERQDPVAYMDEALRLKWLIDHDSACKLIGTKLYATPQPDIPEGWQAVVSEFIAAWDGSADPKAVGSMCRFIRAEIALRDLIAPKQEEMK